MLHAIGDCQQGDHRHRHARDIDGVVLGFPELGQEDRAEDDKRGHHGNGHEKDGTPPEILEQQATDERA